MKKSELFPNLPDIYFTDSDTDTITAEIISAYETASGRTLATADPVRIFMLTIADVIAQQRVLIDIAAKNNLLAYAEGSYLDHIGALLGVTRKADEDDESLRQRIHIAPESFSVAGPVKAYEFHAKNAHPDIADVRVLTPPDTDPGHVHIYPLLKNGELPSTEIIDAVFMACSGDDVRPDTDYVEVLAPESVSYSVEADYWINADDSASVAHIQLTLADAVNDYVAWQGAKLGRDIVPSLLTHYMFRAKIKRCNIISPSFTAIKPNQVATCSGITLNYKGLEGE